MLIGDVVVNPEKIAKLVPIVLENLNKAGVEVYYIHEGKVIKDKEIICFSDKDLMYSCLKLASDELDILTKPTKHINITYKS